VHVGFALLTLFPGRVGGSEANVRGLLGQYADGNGPEQVTVLANRLVERDYAPMARGPVRLHRVRSYRAGDSAVTRLAAMTSAGLAPWLAARDVPAGLDVIHHPVTVPIPRVKGVPTVTTVFDLQHHDLPHLFSGAERAFRRWAYDGAARAADAVVTTSRYSRDRLLEVTGIEAEKVHVVPMGIDHDRFSPEPGPADARVRDRLPARYVVYPGNLWPHKNHERLVRALARTSDPELALVLTGQQYDRMDALMAVAREVGVADRVAHLGHVAADELPAVMRSAQAMVFPSLYEGFGSPPLEAMACGCPVASSLRASLEEGVGDAALPLDPEDVDAIATAIDRVTTDERLRSRLRANGLERAARFDWSAAASAHRAIYRGAGNATFGAREGF
jgi:glycosyltransferase involved in cell wall biosynthesis